MKNRMRYVNADFAIIWALLSSILLIVLVSCNISKIPSAIVTSYPSSGDTSVFFEFNASQSYDNRHYQVTLMYRWDFNGDQIWDTGFSTEPIMLKKFNNPGTYRIAVEVRNPDDLSSIGYDSVTVFSLASESSSFTDSRDGQTYSTVKMAGRWWMAESLRYGTEIDPLKTKMSNNGITEKVIINQCHGSGPYCVYSWYEAINYDLVHNKGICPEGWHIPTQEEWYSLYEGYPLVYIAQQLGKKGTTGMNLQEGASLYIDWVVQFIGCDSQLSSYWTSDHKYDVSNVLTAAHLNYKDNSIVIGFLNNGQLTGQDQNIILNSVRCIKDQD